MSKPKFTPGPWWVLHEGSSEVSVQTKGACICSLNYDPLPKEEVQKHLANARLIAAAPELYDALKESVRRSCMRSCGVARPCKMLCPEVEKSFEVLRKVWGDE